MFTITKGVGQKVPIFLSDPDDNETGITGQAGSMTVEICRGGTWSTPTNAPVETAYGFYDLELTDTEANTDDYMILRAWAGSPTPTTNEYRLLISIRPPAPTEMALTSAGELSLVERLLTEDWDNVTGVDSAPRESVMGALLRTGVGGLDRSGAVLMVLKRDGATTAYLMDMQVDGDGVITSIKAQ